MKNRKRKTRKAFYHISERFLREQFVAARQAPAYNDQIPDAPTPRLCVCPTIAGCFSARLCCGHRDIFVYKTPPRRTIKPVKVYDAILTQERWIIPPVTLSLFSVVPAPVVAAVSCETSRYVSKHCKGPPVPFSARQYLESLDILEAAGVEITRFERRYIGAVVKKFEG